MDKVKFAGYLRVLNESAFLDFVLKNQLESAPIVVPDIADITPVDVLDCLGSMLDYEVWPGYLFNCSLVWRVYLESIVLAPRFMQGIDLMLQVGTPGDLIMFFNACYKFESPAISDQDFDSIERMYIATFPNLEYLTQITNADMKYSEMVLQAIRLSAVKSSKDTNIGTPSEGSYAALNSEKSTSIKPLRDYQEVYDFLLNAPECTLHWSLKMDGINTKTLFKSDGSGLDVALSRGRSADSWDFTEGVNRILKASNIDVSKLSGKITGETIVDSQAMEMFRHKYSDKEYKSPKSLANAMLRAPQKFEELDYQHLKFYPFYYEEYLKDEAFAKLEEAGFTVPPYIRTEKSEVPLNSLDEFVVWIEPNILDKLWEAGGCKQEESDGVVLQLLTTVENDRNDKYSDLNVALKLYHWSELGYVSTVKNIIFEQQRVYMSVVLEVEPVTTRDLNVATRVSVGSPAILVADNVRIGDKIHFTRKSEAINIYEGKCS